MWRSLVSQPGELTSGSALSATELRSLIESYVQEENPLEALMNRTDGNEHIQPLNTRKAVTTHFPNCNGEPESFRNWVRMFARFASNNDFEDTLHPGISVLVGEEVDVGVMPKVDDSSREDLSATHIRQRKGAWNSLYLVCPDVTYQSLMDILDSPSSVFAAL